MSFLNSLSAAGFLGWLADFYLLATLLMLIAVVARRLIRQPAQRLAVNWVVAFELATLAVVCALPFWPRVSLVGAVRQTPEVESPVPVSLPPAAFSGMPRPVSAFSAPSNLNAPEPTAAPVSSRPRWSWIEFVVAGYLASAGLVVLWLLWGAVAAARACWRADDAPQLLREQLAEIVGAGRREPRLLVSSQVTTAVALGLRRPAILLPAGLVRGGSPPMLRAVLTHEWAHIRNGDLWLLALGRGLLVLLFPHPLFWWLRRAIRGDQELLADAAAAGDNRPGYAEELLRLARKTAYPSPIAASGAIGIWESSSQLSRRIAMLLDESFRVEPNASRRWRYRALGLLAILGAGCSLLTLQPGRSAGQVAEAAPAVNGDSPRTAHQEITGVTGNSGLPAEGKSSVAAKTEVAPAVSASDGPAVSIEVKPPVPAKTEPLGVSYTVGTAASMEAKPPVPAKTEPLMVSGTVSAASAESKPPALITAGSAVLTYAVQPTANTLVITNTATLFPTSAKTQYRPMALPVYVELFMPDQRKGLGFEFSEDQSNKLGKLSIDFQKAMEEVSKEMRYTTDQAEQKRHSTAFQRKLNDQRNYLRKQVRAVLTPQQWQTYLAWKLDGIGSLILMERTVGERVFGVGISPEQQQKLDVVKNDFLHQYGMEAERFTSALVAVLSQKQTEQLRPVVGERILAQDESFWSSALQTGPVKGPNGAMYFPAAPDAQNANLVQEERDLQYTPVVDKLGLSALQKKQFTEIDTEHRKQTEKFVEEVKKLSPDKRRQPDIREKAARMRDEIRQKIRALLTPQQWAALKDYEFRESGARMLMEIAAPEMFFDPAAKSTGVKEKAALDEAQMASLRRIVQEHNIGNERYNEEAGRKAFAVLTTEQQDKIRDYIENRQ